MNRLKTTGHILIICVLMVTIILTISIIPGTTRNGNSFRAFLYIVQVCLFAIWMTEHIRKLIKSGRNNKKDSD